MPRTINSHHLFVDGAEVRNLQLEKLAADPTGAGLLTGRTWYNTTENVAKYYDGTAVVPYPAGAVSTDIVIAESPTGATFTVGAGTPDTIALVDGTNAGLMAPADKTKLDDLSNIAGQYTGTVSTSAALDALVDAADGSGAVENGDWAILDTDEGGRQAGIYFHDGTNWAATPGYQFPDTFTTATEAAEGVAEIATQAETDAGTDDARFITPLKLRSNLAARGGEILVGDGTTGPFVTAHGLTLGTAVRLDMQVTDAATGLPYDVDITNDGTNITVTPVAAIANNAVRVTYHLVD